MNGIILDTSKWGISRGTLWKNKEIRCDNFWSRYNLFTQGRKKMQILHRRLIGGRCTSL